MNVNVNHAIELCKHIEFLLICMHDSLRSDVYKEYVEVLPYAWLQAYMDTPVESNLSLSLDMCPKSPEEKE